MTTTTPEIRTRLWQRPDWLPRFEEIEPPPGLAAAFDDHRAAAEALSGAQAAGDEQAQGECLARVCDAAETILQVVPAEWPAVEEARRAAAERVTPKTKASGDLPDSGFEFEDHNRKAAEVNRKITAEQRELRPRRRAFERDVAGLKRLLRLVEPNVLAGGSRAIPGTQAEVEQARRDLQASGADLSLEQRVERLERGAVR